MLNIFKDESQDSDFEECYKHASTELHDAKLEIDSLRQEKAKLLYLFGDLIAHTAIDAEGSDSEKTKVLKEAALVMKTLKDKPLFEEPSHLEDDFSIEMSEVFHIHGKNRYDIIQAMVDRADALRKEALNN